MLKQLIRRFDWRTKSDAIIRQFFADLPDFQPTNGRVLMYVGISSMYLSPTEILLYHLLRQRGFEVDYLVYDRSVPINEVLTKEREETQGREKFFAKSCSKGERMLDAGKVDYQFIPIAPQAVAMSQGAKTLDAILEFQFDGVHFGSIVEGALYRYYKSLTFGDDALDVARRALTTALSNYLCVKDLTTKQTYDFVMFSHGIYMTWQPVVQFCKIAQLPYVCYDRAKTRDHGNFNINQPSADWSFSSAWRRYTDRQLTDDERAQVRGYLQERETQHGDVYAYNFSGRAKDLAAERQRLGIPDDRRVVTFFTNLIWDAANVSRDLAFPSALDCVVQTIEHFRERSDVQVVLRSHPAEKVLGTRDRYADLVLDRFEGQLPENVTLVTPDDDVNSFTMTDLSDICVINTSTVGLEIAAQGKPVVLISQTHYRERGFTYDVSSKDDYFEQIESLIRNPKLLPNQVEHAEKYFYMMMFCYQHKLPARYSKEGPFLGYDAKNFAALSNQEPLVQICDRLAAGVPTDFVVWPQADG